MYLGDLPRKSKEKKEIVIREGTKSIFCACPCCGLNKKLHKKDKGKIKFDIDLDRLFFIQARYSYGRASGWFTNDDESLTLEQAKEMPEYQDLIEQIRMQCKKILKELQE